ncbi:hypothetical protein [Flagellimonas olearia]|uniref:hypothetical protein n=1 Tax=Flagellimonas olearia TaxID=552546 RepID=UPI0013EB09CA|nr:hypothetical protein [Allomuricauda olearia]
MGNLFKAMVLLLILGSTQVSCTKESIKEEMDLYEQATEGDDETPSEKKGDPNQ